MKLALALAALLLPQLASADPQLTSWLTASSGKYARVYASAADQRAGKTSTTWENPRFKQELPAYCGVQEISFSAEWIYIRTTGLGNHVMGPWFNDAAHSRPFVNLPLNQQRIFRIPRHPSVATEPARVRGDIGLFVDGVHAYDSSDARSYSAAERRDSEPPGRGAQGDRLWNRDAFVNEAVTFDAALAHQQNSGDYHYHANPVAPRFQLGDHVEFDSGANVYRESKALLAKHSPIVGWAKDGCPIYGPYGFSKGGDSASGVRRMVSGFIRRDGKNGTTALATNGRHTLPAWAARSLRRTAQLIASEYGPDVSASFPLGRYLEDNEYLGDLGRKQGADFDLDEHNGRRCVTPEFPEGTYAYFVTIDAEGAPLFPYNLGRTYYGVPRGGEVREISEPVTKAFSGGPDLAEKVISATPKGAEVTLTWSSVEGGTYRVETAAKPAPEPLATAIPARIAASETSTVARPAAPVEAPKPADFNVVRTALEPFQSVVRAAGTEGPRGGGPRGDGPRGEGPRGDGDGPPDGGRRDDGPPRGGPRGEQTLAGLLSVSPKSAKAGSTVTITLQLDPSVRPPPPHAPVLRVAVGEIQGANRVHVSRTEVTAEVTIPRETPAGALAVSVTFPGPPDRPQDRVTYTLTGAFTVEAPSDGGVPKTAR